MKRRNFLQTSTLSSLLTTFGLTGCTSDSNIIPGQETVEGMAFPLEEYTVNQLQAAMNDGIHTARSIAELYLKRIDEIDKNRLNSVIEVNPEALKIADELDDERASGTTRGPLHGIPVMIKDNIDTADQIMTTADLWRW